MKSFLVYYNDSTPSGAKFKRGQVITAENLEGAYVSFNKLCVARDIDPEILSIEPTRSANDEIELFVGGNVNTMGD